MFDIKKKKDYVEVSKKQLKMGLIPLCFIQGHLKILLDHQLIKN